MVKKNEKENKLYRYSFIILVISISIGAVFYGLNYFLYRPIKNSSDTTPTRIASPSGSLDNQNSKLEIYTDNDFGFSIYIPRLLKKTEIDTKGRYLKFYVFSENTFSQGRGLALGIRRDSLNEEVVMIKKEMSQESVPAKLTDEIKREIAGFNADFLYYEPQDPSLGEKRVIAIIYENNYSISISTVPEQIQEIMTSFRLVNPTGNPTQISSPSSNPVNSSNGFCGGFMNQPCPKGFKCAEDATNSGAGGTCVPQ